MYRRVQCCVCPCQFSPLVSRSSLPCRKTHPQFTYGQQHDAQELLKCLLTSLRDHVSHEGEEEEEEEGWGGRLGEELVNTAANTATVGYSTPKTRTTEESIAHPLPRKAVRPAPQVTLPVSSASVSASKRSESPPTLASGSTPNATNESPSSATPKRVSAVHTPHSATTEYAVPMSPPIITERGDASFANMRSKPAKVKNREPIAVAVKPERTSVSSVDEERLIVKIQRKDLSKQFTSKKRRKKPKRSPWAKKKQGIRKPKATPFQSDALTITTNTKPVLMVRIPLRLLKGPPGSQPPERLQGILRGLPLSPKTPTFDRCFLVRTQSVDQDTSYAPDFISELFQGHLMYGTKCLDCEQCTGKEESFLDLSVPIPPDSFLGSVNLKCIPLEECIEYFAASEFLSGDNKYFCEECNHLTEAERFIKLSSLPPILVLHINRFSHNSIFNFFPKYRSSASSKLCNCITIPQQLSLERWCMRKCRARPCLYQLSAVVFHTGVSVTSGHYTVAVLSGICRPVSKVRPSRAPPPRGGEEGLSRAGATQGGVVNHVQDGDIREDSLPAAESPEGSQTSKSSSSNNPSNVWYYFDDKKVSTLEPKHFSKLLSSSKTPYILFYCNTDTAGL